MKVSETDVKTDRSNTHGTESAQYREPSQYSTVEPYSEANTAIANRSTRLRHAAGSYRRVGEEAL